MYGLIEFLTGEQKTWANESLDVLRWSNLFKQLDNDEIDMVVNVLNIIITVAEANKEVPAEG